MYIYKFPVEKHCLMFNYQLKEKIHIKNKMSPSENYVNTQREISTAEIVELLQLLTTILLLVSCFS